MPGLFPTEILSTCFGIVNTTARCFTILSPLVAEIRDPWPMMMFAAMAVFALLCTFCLREQAALDLNRTTIVDDGGKEEEQTEGKGSDD